jgi:hypothetical protein
METHDHRVIHARDFLADARTREPEDLLLHDLVSEDAELRRCLAWVIDVVDDYADTELDEDVTQVTLWGGFYVAPADVAALCGGCVTASPARQGERASDGRRSALLADLDAPLGDRDGELNPRRARGLPVDPGQVRLDGLDADVEGAGDLLVGAPIVN